MIMGSWKVVNLVICHPKIRGTQAIKHALIKPISALISQSDPAYCQPILATENVRPNDNLLQRHLQRQLQRVVKSLCTAKAAKLLLQVIKLCYSRMTSEKAFAMKKRFTLSRDTLCRHCSSVHKSGCCDKYQDTRQIAIISTPSV